MTAMDTPGQTEYATARYNGVAVWRSVDPLRDQVRTIQQHETIELLADQGGGWLRVRLPEGLEGFVQRNALRPFVPGMATAPPSAPPAAGAFANQSAGRPFPGAGRAGMGLVIFAWLTFVGGQLLGIGAAADYNCSEAFGLNDCSDESGSRIVIYGMIAVPSFISALFAWGIAYCLSLLDHIERTMYGHSLSPTIGHTPVPPSPAPQPTSERCEVCGNVFAQGALSTVDGKRICRQCASAAQL